MSASLPLFLAASNCSIKEGVVTQPGSPTLHSQNHAFPPISVPHTGKMPARVSCDMGPKSRSADLSWRAEAGLHARSSIDSKSSWY